MRFAFLQPTEPDDSAFLQDPAWRERSLTYTDGDENQSGDWNYDEWERVIKVPQVDSVDIFEQARARLINFDIIPLTIMQVSTQWNFEGRLPQQGDVIFQRTRLVRLGSWHVVDVLSATRLGEVVNEPDYFSLVYIATKGHPEKGYSRYSLCSSGEHSVTFKIETTSQPAKMLTKLANPIITRRTQLKITHSVLDTMERGVIMNLRGTKS